MTGAGVGAQRRVPWQAKNQHCLATNHAVNRSGYSYLKYYRPSRVPRHKSHVLEHATPRASFTYLIHLKRRSMSHPSRTTIDGLGPGRSGKKGRRGWFFFLFSSFFPPLLIQSPRPHRGDHGRKPAPQLSLSLAACSAVWVPFASISAAHKAAPTALVQEKRSDATGTISSRVATNPNAV